MSTLLEKGNSMLILTRHVGEQVVVGDYMLIVTVVSVVGDRVRLGFTADRNIEVDRLEIRQRKDRHKKEPEQ